MTKTPTEGINDDSQTGNNSKDDEENRDVSENSGKVGDKAANNNERDHDSGEPPPWKKEMLKKIQASYFL